MAYYELRTATFQRKMNWYECVPIGRFDTEEEGISAFKEVDLEKVLRDGCWGVKSDWPDTARVELGLWDIDDDTGEEYLVSFIDDAELCI